MKVETIRRTLIIVHPLASRILELDSQFQSEANGSLHIRHCILTVFQDYVHQPIDAKGTNIGTTPPLASKHSYHRA